VNSTPFTSRLAAEGSERRDQLASKP